MNQVTVLEISTNVVEVAVAGPQGPTGPIGPQGNPGSPGTTTWAGITAKPTTVAGFGITDAEKTTNKGIANGYAGLDGTGKVPAAQLPSYVDDVLEFANLAAFPAVGETGKIYIALDTNFAYRWSGSTYIRIVASPGSTDALAEGTTNLYFTPARVLSTLIAGLSTATNAVITTADSVLVALGKLQKQITDLTTTVAAAGYLAATNTWTGANKFSVNPVVQAVAGASANSTRGFRQQIDGSEYMAIYHDGTNVQIQRNGTNVLTIGASALSFPSNYALSFAGTGAATTLANLGGAPLASPPLTGTPTAPTATTLTATTQLATTAFVQGEFAARAGVNSGLATLDSSGKVLTSQLPPLAINDVFTVATQAAMLALTAQRGDVAIRTDTTSTFILSTDSPSTLADWKQVLNPSGAISTVFGRTGTVVSANGDYTATQITNTPAGNIAATTVQAAINELDSEKQPLMATAMSGTWTPALKFGGNAVGLTTSTLIGSYERIGNLVYYYAYIVLSAKGSSTGLVSVAGLPFTPPTMASICNIFAATGMLVWSGSKGVISPTTSTINIYLAGSSNDAQASDANFSNTSTILIQGVLSLGSLT